MTPKDHAAPPPVPKGFWEYVRSFGPGFIAVLAWLGAGDIVAAGVAGGNYGYALMWAMVVALLVRYLFVSLTILANSFSVVMIPALAGGLWCITARKRFIGAEYCNRWWDNAVMAFLFVLALYGGYEAVKSILSQLKII